MPSNQLIKKYKAALFLAALLPLARLIWLAATDGLGANPVEFVIHSLGTWTLVSLLVTLSLTPLRLLTGIAWPLQLRRMCGLLFAWSALAKDIVKHPYMPVGFTALVLMIPLAATSNRYMIRRLGKRWQTLHRLVYLIAIRVYYKRPLSLNLQQQSAPQR